ncbi:MAG TPA: hypothetical protein QGF63_12355 [Alphaproteobacteria bacterium]|nr:hypothetical protein [Alphaproteobacteria bacterium]MDP7164660.1 hypothetical protein [Alphaproteobacteria bacterium]MDP7427124.1 hypothetical protein [Alphaproteobacteria bacterium]HJM50626.1 hypothetical protein [Alphaproteobacteria bacterium]
MAELGPDAVFVDHDAVIAGSPGHRNAAPGSAVPGSGMRYIQPMATIGRYLAGWPGEAIVMALGIVLAMVPLALWFAWTETLFFAVLGIGAGSFTLIYLLGRISAPDPQGLVAAKLGRSQKRSK